MAAHSFLQIGELWIFAYRQWYSEPLAAMFRDDENVSEEQSPVYAIKAGHLKARLNVLGFTSGNAASALERTRAALLVHEDDEHEFPAFDDWLSENIGAVSDGTIEGDDVPAWVGELDPRLVVRRVLDFVPDQTNVSLDLSDVVSRGYVIGSPTLCQDAFKRDRAASTGPLVIITEGSSDAAAISAALELLYPHLSGYITFLDYTWKPEGSASALVRAVRAFAAAGISNHVIALFDNDTAASEALTSLDIAALPANFRVLQLPEIELARNYPTFGPTGPSDANINGRAVAIEMFFGRDVLSTSDGLSRVQWTGYSSKLGQYQGEVLGKSDVQARFWEKVGRARAAGIEGQDWREMQLLLDTLAAAFD